MSSATRCDIACKIPDDGGDRRLGALTLPMDTRSVAVARRHVVDVARAWGVRDDVVELAELLCSEIVTNAVIHPKCAAEDAVVEVAVVREGRRLIVECRDPGVELPRVVGVPDPLREDGRGILLVATLAYDHGVHLIDDSGKTVWFELIAWPEPTAG